MFQKELIIQAKVFTDFWNAYPEERQLLHNNNNNSSDKREGAKNKSLGVVRGICDMEYVKSGMVHFIEFKVDDNEQTPEQKTFQQKIEREGFLYHLVYGQDALVKLLQSIRTGKIKENYGLH